MLINRIRSVRSHSSSPLLLLLLFTLLFRIVFIDMISTNGDPMSYWGAAKSFSTNEGYVQLFHQSVRFSLVAIIYIFQLIFGTSPVTYYLPFVVISVITTWYLYNLVQICSNETKAFIVTLIFILNPIFYMHGYAYLVHPYPEPVELLFTVMSFYFLAQWNFRKQMIGYVIIAALLMFLAYEAKETAVFMMGAGLFVLRKQKKHLLTYAGILAVLFLSETVAYRIFAHAEYGRISILLHSHFDESNASLKYLSSPVDLLNRFIELKYTSRIFYFAFFAATPFYLLRRYRSEQTTFLLAAAWSFIIPITIAVKGLHPIQVALPFNTRYMNIALPYVIAIDLFAIVYIIERIKKSAIAEKLSPNAMKLCTKGLALILILSAGIVFYQGKTSSFYRLYQYNHMIDTAMEKGTPIVSIAEGDSRQHKQILVASHLFGNDPEYVHQRLKRHSKFSSVLFFSSDSTRPEPAPEDPIVFVMKNPFRAVETTLKEALLQQQHPKSTGIKSNSTIHQQ